MWTGRGLLEPFFGFHMKLSRVAKAGVVKAGVAEGDQVPWGSTLEGLNLVLAIASSQDVMLAPGPRRGATPTPAAPGGKAAAAAASGPAAQRNLPPSGKRKPDAAAEEVCGT